MSNDEYRLPTAVSPTHYNLSIRTDLEALKFNGAVDVDLLILEETRRIVLNAADLELGNVSILLDNAQTLVPVTQSLDKLNERATFVFPATLPAGSRGLLRISFAGSIDDNMVGYFKSSWKKEGRLQNYALTQFEASLIIHSRTQGTHRGLLSAHRCSACFSMLGRATDQSHLLHNTCFS